jgi:hypothetical protein
MRWWADSDRELELRGGSPYGRERRADFGDRGGRRDGEKLLSRGRQLTRLRNHARGVLIIKERRVADGDLDAAVPSSFHESGTHRGADARVEDAHRAGVVDLPVRAGRQCRAARRRRPQHGGVLVECSIWVVMANRDLSGLQTGLRG